MNIYDPSNFMDGRTPANDEAREKHCKYFCKYRKKHKCAKFKCRITLAEIEPELAEQMMPLCDYRGGICTEFNSCKRGQK